MSEARHNPEAFFEANGWPDAADRSLYNVWSTTVDQSAPDSEPADVGDPDPWFPPKRRSAA
jgi:hypothetical protein